MPKGSSEMGHMWLVSRQEAIQGFWKVGAGELRFILILSSIKID